MTLSFSLGAAHKSFQRKRTSARTRSRTLIFTMHRYSYDREIPCNTCQPSSERPIDEFFSAEAFPQLETPNGNSTQYKTTMYANYLCVQVFFLFPLRSPLEDYDRGLNQIITMLTYLSRFCRHPHIWRFVVDIW